MAVTADRTICYDEQDPQKVEGLHFRGVAPNQMITDKISAVSSDKVFRRIKDVVDLYYLSKVYNFNKDDVLQRLKNSSRQLESFHGFLHRRGELEHSYEKFRFTGDVGKPPFDEMYHARKTYQSDLAHTEKPGLPTIKQNNEGQLTYFTTGIVSQIEFVSALMSESYPRSLNCRLCLRGVTEPFPQLHLI